MALPILISYMLCCVTLCSVSDIKTVTVEETLPARLVAGSKVVCVLQASL